MPESAGAGGQHATPYLEIERATWASLAQASESPLSEIELVQLRGLGDRLDLTEVSEVYLPLSRLLTYYVSAARRLHEQTSAFLGQSAGGPHHGSSSGNGAAAKTPFVIAVAGSVAVGKSTTARLLRELMSRWPESPRVELVTTDGFLYPNAELERRGLLGRKGFPESYDRRALTRFVQRVKSGVDEVRAPVYSHLYYDIVPDAEIVVHRPDVLIVEGLNVLQPASGATSLAVSDLFDFSIYVDARAADIARWYEERFLRLQQSAFANPHSYFHRYASLTEAEARSRAQEIWAAINEPNLVQNVAPTRARASLVLRKGSDHAVSSVLLRKI